MSTSVEITLWCDADDCPMWFGYGTPLVRVTRKAAAREGWVYCKDELGLMRDLCPDCAAKEGAPGTDPKGQVLLFEAGRDRTP